MNKKVLKTMIILVVVFLVALYVLKIFFPEQFVMALSNDTIKAIGDYIDAHTWLLYLCSGITAFITYWLYCCASAGRKCLKWYECLEILGVIVIVRVVSLFDTTLSTAIQLASFLFLPALMHGSLRNSAIVYTIHVIAQGLSLGIRNLPIYLTTTNSATIFMIGIECYFWLLLNYLLFSYEFKKKEIK